MFSYNAADWTRAIREGANVSRIHTESDSKNPFSFRGLYLNCFLLQYNRSDDIDVSLYNVACTIMSPHIDLDWLKGRHHTAE